MTELLREYWDLFLFDTLLWTSVLIAFVLLVRRPVTRHLGAGAAYALWALPAIRLLMPPMTLPAWMAPKWSAATVEPFAQASTATTPQAFPDFVPADAAGDIAAAQIAAQPIDFITPLAVLWLVGAMVFMARRFWLYAQLRRELLEDAIPVGDVGAIRLIETPAISGPMAFGVLDKVIALPLGFMTARDRTARDLAIAHELAHHRGHDLLVNILVQPLFAAHWFNPLGYMGWQAMRRDQEAACDARVVASRPRKERAVYAGVIADFARRPQVAPRPALAAPMACPVLGDKSIIHRLRILSMSDISPRRRVFARSGVAAALFALPMTASLYYSAAVAAPLETIVTADDPAEAMATAKDTEVVALAEVRRDREETIARVQEAREAALSEYEKARDAALAQHENARAAALAEHDRARTAALAEERRARAIALRQSEKARVVALAEHERASKLAVAEAEEARVMALELEKAAPLVVQECRDKENIVSTETNAEGRTVMYVCEANANRIAIKSVRIARRAIAKDRNLSDAERGEALRALDEEIAKLSRQ